MHNNNTIRLDNNDREQIIMIDNNNRMQLYDYNETLINFERILQANREKAFLKKEEYLQKIMLIFTQFVKKCEKEINAIILKKIGKLQSNYDKVKQYMQATADVSHQQKSLIISQFLIKPFERFPFSGHKNEKLFREQYNLIEKASILIEQTLVDSFNEDEVPNFQNHKFFSTIQNGGVGQQSLTRLRLNPQSFHIQFKQEITPIQKNIKSVKLLSSQQVMLMGDDGFIEVWDLSLRECMRKVYLQAICNISCVTIYEQDECRLLLVGFDDEFPQIWSYRVDNWQRYGSNLNHTRKITKLVQMREYFLSGSLDGNVCIHSVSPFKCIQASPHISSIEDIIIKNSFVYVLLKCSTVCQYDFVQGNGHNNGHNNNNNNNNNNNEEGVPVLQFRRTLSTGYISMIRFPEQTSNFSGVACHIYGLSQIEITRKFKVEEINIINVAQMISDFIVLQSKETSEYFAVCTFQNSSAIRIYSLLSQELIYQLPTDYMGEVGVAGYLPKMEIAYIDKQYWLIIVCQAEFTQQSNKVRLYKLSM